MHYRKGSISFIASKLMNVKAMFVLGYQTLKTIVTITIHDKYSDPYNIMRIVQKILMEDNVEFHIPN